MIKAKVDSREKRLQMPGTFIDIACSICGKVQKVELVDQIYYPGEGKPHGLAIECCDKETEIEVKVDIFAEITILKS